MNSLGQITQFRLHNNSLLPGWYSSWIHVVLNSAIFFLMSFVLINSITFNITSIAWLVLFFFCWSVIEYLIHRFILHGQIFSKFHFRKQHSVYHHGYFTHQFMEGEEPVDLNRILLFPWDLAVLLLVTLLMSLPIYSLDRNTGHLFFLAAIFYFIVYEIVHAICHGKFNKVHPVFKSVVDNHRGHHDPSQMQKANFSVVLPVIDSIFFTRKRSPHV